jgi:hypothetical protein
MKLNDIITSIVIILSITTKCYCQHDAIVPHNKIALTSKVNVDQSNNLFQYRFILSNGVTAQQSVWMFDMIIKDLDSLKMVTQPLNWEHFMFPKHNKFEWCAVPMDTVNGYIAPINPGQTLSGFSFSSAILPGIVTYYAEGDGPIPHFDEGCATDEPIPGYDDLTPYGPGVVGKTIGPIIVPNSVVPLTFLDTLTSFTIQSRMLGWIKDDVTANRYFTNYASSKSKLLQHDILGATAVLQQVLKNVDIDSASTLTSEAYALLRFNTEYLIIHL